MTIEIYHKRLRVVTLLVVGIFSLLIMRLWLLQIVQGPDYRLKSEANRIHLQDIPPVRGMIFDRHGELLVDNRPSYDMYIIPERVQSQWNLLANLRALAGLNPEEVRETLIGGLKSRPFKPVLIKKSLTRDELAVIETNLFNLPGIMIQVSPRRHYIFTDFASHVIGYLGEISEAQLASGAFPDSKPADLIGKVGVEGRWQTDLNGRRGGEQVEVDAAGRKLRVLSKRPPLPGMNLTLTIDKNLQFVAEEALKGKKGAVVAMNPMNGEILACASSPAFDPNVFIEGIDKTEWNRMVSSKDYPLQNRAISGQYPPGSTFKIVVALAALEEGVIEPDKEIFCPGRYHLGRHVFRCWKKGGHGKVDLHKALVESCDVYFYTVGKRLGVDRIAQYAMMLGLGRKTRFDLDFERPGLIPTSQWKLKRWGVPWQAGETISTSIGQSFVLATPIQMARLIAAVFNGGYLFQPKIIKHVGKDHRETYKFSPKVVGRVAAKPENLELIKNALVGVVNQKGGTAYYRARIKGVSVAGKTGTSQVVNLEAQKNSKNGGKIPMEFRDHAWFVAIAPADKPALAVAVLVEHGEHGSSAAAPVAKQMIEAYLGKKKKAKKEG